MALLYRSCFGGLQRSRSSTGKLVGVIDLQNSPSVTQKRTRIMDPPYREINLEEKALKRIEGVSMCPTNCLCSRKIEITYKNFRLLSQFTSQQTGVILPRTITKVCLRKQKRIAKEIKKARTMGFLPYTCSLPQYHSDPKLFNRNRTESDRLAPITRGRVSDLTRLSQILS